MKDQIVLRGIEFLASHGATEEERLRRQRFSVDVTLSLDLSSPAKSDRLADTADYAELGEMVIRIATESRHHLLESLAQEIIVSVQERWESADVTITVRKLQPPVAFSVQSIEVSITSPATRPGA